MHALLVYAGRAGTGIKQAELERLWRRLQPLATVEMPFERVGIIRLLSR